MKIFAVLWRVKCRKFMILKDGPSLPKHVRKVVGRFGKKVVLVLV